jgi:hypothetical protein
MSRRTCRVIVITIEEESITRRVDQPTPEKKSMA